MTRRPLVSEEDQGVTFVELFFDLVFVFAITELTALTAEHLTWTGIGRSLLVFWLVWWAWTQFTWALNPADTTLPAVQATTLAATAVAFVMAASVHDAFGDDGGGAWFAVPYVGVRLIGLGLYARVAAGDEGFRRAVVTFAALSLSGMIAVLAGAAVDPPARSWCWMAAIAFDVLAAVLAGRHGSWGIRAGHFAERHGLFVIIALGESLIAAGVSVVGAERTSELIVVALGAVVVTVLLWWTYFGWVSGRLEEHLGAVDPAGSGAVARDVFSLLHFPLIGGVVGLAVGYEELIAHPDEPLGVKATAAFAVGLLLFVGSTAAAHWRAGGQLLRWRLPVVGGAAALLLVLGDPEPLLALGVACAALVVVVVAEARTNSGQSSASGWNRSRRGSSV